MNTPRITLLTALAVLVLTPAVLLAQQALARHADLYVDAAATENGDGSRDHPFWRITDGVVAARALRHHHHGITLHVLPGTYVGSYDPDHLASDPRLELLPIILNVSDLSLEGGTELDEDNDGLPTGTYPPKSETMLTIDDPLNIRGGMLLLIASTTDGMAGNRVTVSGFVLDAGSPAPPPSVGGVDIYIDRVSDFSIHRNLFQHADHGIQTRLASGILAENFIGLNNTVGAFITGGSRIHTASVTVRRNRSTRNTGGTTVSAVGSLVQLQLGTNPLMLEPLPMSYDLKNPEDQQKIPNTLRVTIEGNDFGDNRDFGLRCTFYPPLFHTTADTTQPITGALSASVRDNVINRNVEYGIFVDAGYSYRSIPQQLTGTFEGTFERNALIDNGRNASFIGFTVRGASTGIESRENRKYMQESTFQVADLDGELHGFDFDNLLYDPFDNSPVVGNVIIYKPNGIRITPRP